jgi:hypothetical protein
MTLLPTPRSTLDLETAFGRVRLYEFGAASADRAAIPVVLRRVAGGQLRRPPWKKPHSWTARSSRSWQATTADVQIYPRSSGESVTRSWQRPASQAARVSWMSRRVWLRAVI